MAPSNGAQAANPGGRTEVQECGSPAREVPEIRRRGAEGPGRSHPLVHGTSRSLTSPPSSGGAFGEKSAHSPPQRTVEGLRGRSDRERAEASSVDAVHLRPRASGAVAQQRGGEPGPTGSVVPENQGRPSLVDGRLGVGAIAVGLSNVSEARARIPPRGERRAPRGGLPGLRRSLKYSRKLNGHDLHSSWPLERTIPETFLE